MGEHCREGERRQRGIQKKGDRNKDRGGKKAGRKRGPEKGCEEEKEARTKRWRHEKREPEKRGREK